MGAVYDGADGRLVTGEINEIIEKDANKQAALESRIDRPTISRHSYIIRKLFPLLSLLL